MFVTLANTTASRRVERSPPFHPARSTCMVYRGTSLIINRAPLGPYSTYRRKSDVYDVGQHDREYGARWRGGTSREGFTGVPRS